MLFPILGPSSQSVVVAQPDKKHAKRTASASDGRTDPEHITSGSNEEVLDYD